MKFQFIPNDILVESGAPPYINERAFSSPRCFRTLSVNERPLTPKKQDEYLQIAIEDAPGWLGFVTSPTYEMGALFAHTVARNIPNPREARWHRVSSGRGDPLIEGKRITHYPNLIVLDCLLTSQVKESDQLQFDPVRVGRIHDICSRYRGRTSVLVICPGLDMEDAIRLVRQTPDLMFGLKTIKGDSQEL